MRAQSDSWFQAEEMTCELARKIAWMLTKKVRSAIYFSGDFRCENRKLTQAYALAAIKAGAQFREGAMVEAIRTNSSGIRGVRLHDGSEHDADVVVVAAGSWSGQIRGV